MKRRGNRDAPSYSKATRSELLSSDVKDDKHVATKATVATEIADADVDDELEAGDDWIPRGSQHEI